MLRLTKSSLNLLKTKKNNRNKAMVNRICLRLRQEMNKLVMITKTKVASAKSKDG